MKDTIIEEISAAPLNLPLTEPFSIATGAQQSADNVLVRLRLADGTVGLGEAAPFPAVSGETRQSSTSTIESAAELLSGLDAREWGRIDALLAQQYPDQPAARCALETAVLDALLQHHHMPLWSFFGGASSSLETDMTVTTGDCAHASLSARTVLAHDINIIKVKLGALSPWRMRSASRQSARWLRKQGLSPMRTAATRWPRLCCCLKKWKKRGYRSSFSNSLSPGGYGRYGLPLRAFSRNDLRR